MVALFLGFMGCIVSFKYEVLLYIVERPARVDSDKSGITLLESRVMGHIA